MFKECDRTMGTAAESGPRSEPVTLRSRLEIYLALMSTSLRLYSDSIHPHTWRYSFKRQILRKISISGWLCTITPVVLVQEANPHKNFHIRLFVHNLSYDTCLSGRSSEKKIHISLVVNNLSCVVFSPLQWAAQFKREPACLHNWRTMLGLRSRQNIS